ncbi:MAG: DEAD/DEAH box helicase [Clostridia bacterium]|nr:DEAD/DEAH box helicase [Clostridia bacterium]
MADQTVNTAQESDSWRSLFTEKQLETGKKAFEDGQVAYLTPEGENCTALLVTPYGGRYHLDLRSPLKGSTWKNTPLRCNCRENQTSRATKWNTRDGAVTPKPSTWVKCDHMVPVFYAWEALHGPWENGNSDGDKTETKKTAPVGSPSPAVKPVSRVSPKLSPLSALEEAWQQGSLETMPVLDVLNHAPTTCPSWWDVRSAMSTFSKNQTNRFFADRLPFLLRVGPTNPFTSSETPDGLRKLSYHQLFRSDTGDVRDEGTATVTIIGRHIRDSSCTALRCRTLGIMCHHQMACWSFLWDWVNRHPVEDMTDPGVGQMMDLLSWKPVDTGEMSVEFKSHAHEKLPSLSLTPRLLTDRTPFRFGFRLGRRSGRQIILKNPYEMLVAERNGDLYQLSKNELVDFARETFMPECEEDVRLLRDRVLQEENQRDYLTNDSTWRLEKTWVDRFYDLHEHESVAQENSLKSLTTLSLDHHPFSVLIKATKAKDIMGQMIALEIACVLPPRIHGAMSIYAWSSQYISRMTPDEMKVVRGIESLMPQNARLVQSGETQVRFRLGLPAIPHFFAHILPRILEVPGVTFKCDCEEEIRAMLPLEPSFSFYLDLVGKQLTCRCKVDYDGIIFYLPQSDDTEVESAEGIVRDRYTENHTREVLNAIFPNYTPTNRLYSRKTDDASLFLFLRSGYQRLENIGHVYTTKAIQKLKMRSLSSISVDVSVNSGLLDLSLQSSNLSQDELLEIWESYEKHQTFFRLKSGEFVDLTDDDALHDLSLFMQNLHLQPRDVQHKQLQIPMYRALYLSSMLMDRDDLLFQKDGEFTAFVDRFASAREKGFPVPQDFQKVLRPYQEEGYVWLRTLYESGLGGILADEMGLGKTVQMIALLRACLDENPDFTALIICPASLVYNWLEELHRFAPSIRCCVVSGQAAQRQSMLQLLEYRMQEGGQKDEDSPDVYITSYNLMSRDISLWEPVGLDLCVLDEAQYIKNLNAGVSKSVRLIRASHRFALTGTPIENRLSELWSIFDFLMPGFLYSQAEFRSYFEEPISHLGDAEATERLRKMTGPFILRRLKQDVLRDLPEKLEEVRYVTMEEDQRRIYDAQVAHTMSVLRMPDSKMQTFTELMRLRQTCCDPSLYLRDYTGSSAKRAGCLDLIQSAMDGGHRMLVFSQFTSMLALLEKDLVEHGIEYFKITGETPKEKRLELVSQFNRSDVPVFLISLKAGGTGLNLTGADIVIHYDPWWNLAAQNQATDRAHRIGQTRQVVVYRLIAKDTIEEKILQLQNTKKDLADSILSGDHTSLLSLSPEELMSLLS